MGWLSNVPLAIGSIITLMVFFDRLKSFRGIEARSRELASRVIDTLVKPDLDGARQLCEASDLPVARMMLETLRWQNIAVDDYDRILATQRAELTTELRRGIWMIGTVGSLAPFVGLFGTVVGIIRGFADLAGDGGGGFAVVAYPAEYGTTGIMTFVVSHRGKVHQKDMGPFRDVDSYDPDGSWQLVED